MESAIVDLASDFRQQILELQVAVKALMENQNSQSGADIGETKANIMLAYRHLEDARMRLGKVLQAQDGGKSVYDK